MSHAADQTPVASPPDPPQDNCDPAVASNITIFLHAVGILLAYGRHLLGTVRQRAATANFNAIAANFGTARVSTILAYLHRGILRAQALERVLLARVAAGKDVDFVLRRARATAAATLSAGTRPDQPAVPLPSRQRAPRPSRPAGWDDPELFMPTLEDMERLVRRRPLGRTICDICLDLAVVPGFCHSQFWNELFELITLFGGGNSVDRLMREKARRRQAFANEQDRNPKATWDWVNMSREAMRQALGFFIGEPPVNPLDPAAAVATAPP